MNFEIQFTYNEDQYTAQVKKIPVVENSAVEYHVSKITPAISGLPEEITFVHEGDEDGFIHTITFDYHITETILNNIAEYCYKNNIAFTS
jgi:hypothetical protein